MLADAKRRRYGSEIAGSSASVIIGTMMSAPPVFARMPSVTL